MATAFAVYSADDNSLNFYKRDTVPSAGNTFNGKTATAVYTGIETDTYVYDYDAYVATTPWFNYAYDIASVNLVDSGIKPVSTAYWFCNMSNASLTTIGGLDKLDTANVTDMSGMFRTCASLTSLDLSSFNTSNVMDMSYMFRGCSALASLNVSSFNTSKVTTMSNMFLDCSALSNIYVSDTWSVANVTRSSSMFSGCSKLPNFDSANTGKSLAYTGAGGYLTCAGFMNNGSGHSYTDGTCTICGKAQAGAFAVYSTDDTSLNFYKRSTVPTVGSTFNGKTATAVYEGIETSVYDKSPWNSYCSSVTSVSVVDSGIAPVSTAWWFYNMNNASLTTIGGLDKLDTSNVTDMSGMFYNCNMLTSLDLSSFNTSNVTNMANMFYGCSKLTSLDVSSFDTSKVTNMQSMFRGCSALTSLDVSSFNTSNVTNMSYMFRSCEALTTIYVGDKWSTAKVTSSSNMFYGCTKLPNFNSSAVDKTKAHYNSGGYLSYISAADKVKVILEKGALDIILNKIKNSKSGPTISASGDTLTITN